MTPDPNGQSIRELTFHYFKKKCIATRKKNVSSDVGDETVKRASSWLMLLEKFR